MLEDVRNNKDFEKNIIEKKYIIYVMKWRKYIEHIKIQLLRVRQRINPIKKYVSWNYLPKIKRVSPQTLTQIQKRKNKYP